VRFNETDAVAVFRVLALPRNSKDKGESSLLVLSPNRQIISQTAVLSLFIVNSFGDAYVLTHVVLTFPSDEALFR